MKLIRVFAIAVLAVGLNAGAELADEAQALLNTTIEENNLAALSAAILKDGEVIWTGGAGYADLENKVPATGAMVHRIASISKPMAAVAAMQLVEQGKLSVDTTFRSLVPEFPEKKWPVKLEHLLTHTSGIRHYEGDSNTAEHYFSLDKSLVRFQDSDLLFEPGTGYQYTTYGYTALGVMIERAADAKFDRYMRDNVWEPTGMMHTNIEDPKDIVENRARPYSKAGRKRLRNAQYADLSYKYPGGGIISTASDLVKFAHAVYTHKLINEETYKQMIAPYTLADGSVSNYGFGWGVGESESYGTQISHSGGQEGTSTLLIGLPDQDMAVAVLSNVDGTFEQVQAVAKGLIEIAAKE